MLEQFGSSSLDALEEQVPSSVFALAADDDDFDDENLDDDVDDDLTTTLTTELPRACLF